MPAERLSDLVELHAGDCLDVLRTMPDGSFDAVVTDPPYNVGLVYSGDATGDRMVDYADWCSEWFAELKRVCRGPLLISCGVANVGTWHAIDPPRWVMCWWKPASSGRCAVGFNNWEPVLVYGKLIKVACDVIRTTEQASLPVRHDREGIAHPCPKPVEWASKLIDLSCPPGGTVLDCFGGSGTTGIAAAHAGRRCTLIEREPAYCDIIRRRVQTETAKWSGTLFGDLAKSETPDMFAETV